MIKASETVGKVISQDAVIIYESTVYPGATEEICVPVLEQFSGLEYNKGFLLAILLKESIRATRNVP